VSSVENHRQRPSDLRPRVRPSRGSFSAGRMQLVDRGPECEVIDRMFEAARGGLSGALVLRGEAGIGKTALLDYAVESAAGMRVARVVGVESEMELAFAAVQQLLAPVLDRMNDLPAPQANALAVALGIANGVSPNKFLVGLGVLNLLSEMARDQPLVCVIDDEQWLDRASAEALAFVARRLGAEGIVLLFAVREPTEARVEPLDRLPELRVEGLAEQDARELMKRAVSGRLDGHVRDRLIFETRGNPLALLELAAELTPAQLAGVSALPEPLPLGARLEQSFIRRVRRLPADTQSLLLLVAAENGGDERFVWRAAEEFGIAPDAAGAAESEGLLHIGHLAFRHPLIRSVVYRTAPMAERRRVHQVLAQATESGLDPDRRAWHLAAASLGPDESVAAELERSAHRTGDRGGYAAAAALLERSARLTPDQRQRAERTLAAAQAELAAGAADKASALLVEASSELTDASQRAQAQRLRGELAFAVGQGGDTATMLLQAARALEAFDARLARDTHLEALEAAIHAGRFGTSGGLLEAGREAVRASRSLESEGRASDLLLDGLALLLTEGHADAAPTLRKAIELLRYGNDPRVLGLGCRAAVELWDDEALHTLATRQVQLARDTGALTTLPRALGDSKAAYELLVGRFDAAERCLDEAREIAKAVGNPAIFGRLSSLEVQVAAWRGLESRARSLAETCAREATARGEGSMVCVVQCATAVLEIGRGRYKAALAAAREACEADYLFGATLTLPDLVEAAARSGEPDVAAAAARDLADATVSSGTEWALGVLARSRALLAPDDDAESLYEVAIDHLKRCRATPQLARARLLYGEWLRRARRRRDAREQLRAAYQMFASMGAEAFAERAAMELAATGKRARARTVETMQLLTSQEERIARLAGEGGSNSEIAAQLLISPRTVEYHLHKVFRKLGVASRTQLAHSLLESGDGGEPRTSAAPG
jgi:DNA-binding CsgD family transcriptional regulator